MLAAAALPDADAVVVVVDDDDADEAAAVVAADDADDVDIVQWMDCSYTNPGSGAADLQLVYVRTFCIVSLCIA